MARSSLSHLSTLYTRSGVADDTGLELSLPCLTCVENALCSTVRVNLCFPFCTSVFLFFFFSLPVSLCRCNRCARQMRNCIISARCRTVSAHTMHVLQAQVSNKLYGVGVVGLASSS